MKTIELNANGELELAEQTQELNQQPSILVLGNRPVAALLPTTDKIPHLATFQHVVEAEETVTLTINGKPVAIVQPLTQMVLLEENGDIDLETVNLSLNPRFLELIERSSQRHKTEGGISSAEMRRRLSNGT